jgi:hypothetical protein
MSETASNNRTDAEKCEHFRAGAERIRRRKAYEYGELLAQKKEPAKFSYGEQSVQMDPEDQPKKEPAKFTQSYVYMHCPAYRRIVERRAKQIVWDWQVHEVADALECTLKQRNELLLAAGYTLKVSFPEGDELEALLVKLRSTLHYLPFPAYIVTRDWNIHDVNYYASLFVGIDIEDFNQIPSDDRNVLNLIFNPNMPFRKMLGGKTQSWTMIAKHNIFGFKSANQGCQYDKWYQKRVASLSKLDDFKEYWEDVKMEFYPVMSGYETEISHISGEVLRFTSLQIELSDFYHYPQIVAYIPQGPDDLASFERSGFPVFRPDRPN